MKLIYREAVVAEIGKRIKAIPIGETDKRLKAVYGNEAFVLNDLLSFLDTLEVKEVDLEDTKKEELAQKYIDYTFKRHNIDPDSREGQLIYYAYIHGMNQCLTQLRTQKGEKV